MPNTLGAQTNLEWGHVGCPSCGALNSESATFCSLCMRPLAEPSAPSPAASAAGLSNPSERGVAAAGSPQLESSPNDDQSTDGLIGTWGVPGEGNALVAFNPDGNLRYGSVRGVWESPEPGLVTLIQENGLRVETRYELIGDGLRLYAQLASPSFRDLKRCEFDSLPAQKDKNFEISTVRQLKEPWSGIARLPARGTEQISAQVVAFARAFTARLAELDDDELIVQKTEPDERVSHSRQSTGEVLGYLPQSE